MQAFVFSRHLVCPWCSKGEVLADAKGKITISAQCPKCRRFFTGSLDTLKTERSTACKQLGKRK
ncbi:MAG: hypothetical protein RR867_07380 [Ruthenibacterium sp.]